MKNFKLSMAHLVGLGLGVLGWLLAIRALPPETPRPVLIFLFSLFWVTVITLLCRVVKQIFPQPAGEGDLAWNTALAFSQKMLWVLAIGAPLYLVGEQIKTLPYNRVATTILYLVYWMALGLGAKAWQGSPKVDMPFLGNWRSRDEKGTQTPSSKELWDVLLWINANIFLMCLVFKGTRQALQGGGLLNLVGIALVIVALYVLGIASTISYFLVRSRRYRGKLCPKLWAQEQIRLLKLWARELIQVIFALGQKGAPFWLATGETPACGVILGVESPLCNVFRIAGLTLASCLAPRNGDKKLTKPQIAKRVLVNGPVLGLFLGTIALLLKSCGTPIPPGVLLGIDLGAYPFVPCTLFLIGTAGLWEVLTAKMEDEGRKVKDLIGPFVFVLIMALGIVPIAAHVWCWWLWVVGVMDHATALGLAQFFAHGCSPTAWGLVALMLGKRDARLYLLFFVITVVGSAFAVPMVYKYCAF